MANDPGAGEGGSPATPSVTYAASVGGSGTGGTSARARAAAKRKLARDQKAIQDNSGEKLIGSDAGGFGLDRPYLDWGVVRAADEATPPVSTTSASFVVLWTAAAEPQHPNIRVRYKVVNGAATTSEIRLRDRTSGTVIAGPTAIGSAATVEGQLEGPLVSPTLTGEGAPMKVDVEARRTGGASTVAVLVFYALGKGG